MLKQSRSRWLWCWFSLGALVGGCGLINPPPKDYCPALAHITLEMGGLTDAVMALDGEDPQTLPTLENITIAFQQQIELMTQLTPAQPQLVTYQNQLGQIYQDYATGTTMMIQARQNRDRDLAIKAQELVSQAGQREANLMPEVTSYCQTPIAERKS
ncbi:MAG: hypothetical protein HC796_04960 [Synechococcaceae cyanobacterium RL_1_2]|nr:hypothetical protein [Synechococcaceae cyanobacterium RL_1_2]